MSRSGHADVLCEWQVLGQSELALTPQEAEDVLELSGFGHLAPEASELRDACSGHPALFAVLASQADLMGIASAVSRTASLDAWLERLIMGHLREELRRALCLANLIRSGREADLDGAGGRFCRGDLA